MIHVTVLERGETRTVVLDEGQLDAFRQSLQARGGVCLEMVRERRPIRRLGAGISLEDWAPWFSALARTLKGGVPLDKSLELLAEAAPLPDQVMSVHQAVVSGTRFSEAISKSMISLPNLVPALLRAGEAAGDLAHGASLVHRSLLDLIAFQRELKSRLSYPLVVVSAAAIALSVLMLKVFPAMAGMWANLGKPLPGKLAAIQFFGWIAIVALVVLALGMAWLMSGSEKALLFPGFRTLGRHRMRCEAWSALAMALGGGVPLLDALGLFGNRWGAQSVRLEIQKGVRPEEALAGWVDDAPGHRAVLLASLRVGDLASGAAGVSEGYRELLDRDLRSLQRWLEPAILVLLGGILLALAWSLFSIMGEMEHGLVR